MGRNVSCSNHLKNIMFMKKIMMTLATLFVAVCASAQVYIGGCAGLKSVKEGKADSKMKYSLVPEIGYEFNKNWEAGLTIGYEGIEDGHNTFTFAPYARYTFYNAKLVDLFIEGSFGYKHFGGNHRDYDGFEFGIKPGLKVNVSDHVAFVSKVGFFGYKQKGEGNDKYKEFGVELDATNVQFGLIYKF